MTVAGLYGIFEKYCGFIRVGSAYIVNLRNVKKVSTNEIQMYPNITVPIPRGKHTEIKSAFWSFQSKEGND
jgi:DNA-binding LytR/AlgR family response regulator